MKLRPRLPHLRSAVLIAAVLALASNSTTVGTDSTLHRRPHMGSPSSDNGTLYQDQAVGRSGWSVSRWGGCRTVVYYYLDGTIPTSWVTPIINGVNAWDSGTYCGADWVRTTNATSARLKFTRAGSLCGSSGTGWIAFACRSYANTTYDQMWWVAFSTYKSFGVGSSGTYDVQSITTNEMGHVMYADHNPSWTDGVTQGNSCTWGATTCRVTNDTVTGFISYPQWCGNCGSRRSVLAGDWDTVKHVYGRPCTTVCPNRADPAAPALPSSAALKAQERAASQDANPADYPTDPHSETMPDSNG